MFENTLVKLACFLLKRELSIENKNRLSTSVLGALGALPVHSMFEISESGELLVGGNIVTPEKALIYRENANSAIDNQLLSLIRDQVTYEAITNGVHKTNGDAGQLFMRAVLWSEQRILEHLKSLAGRSSS